MRALLLSLFLTHIVSSVAAQEWRQLAAAGDGPSARTRGAAMYDSRGNRMILFGGRGSSGDRGDVWAFDLTEHSWSDITPSGVPAPMARFTHNAIYDEVAHQMVIWSGRYVTAEGGGFLNDVWAFDLEEETWTELVTVDPVPLERYGTAAVFHPPLRRLVNFAGFTTAGRFEDVWSFDLGTQVWSEISSISDPGARCLHSASYDDRRQRMIIYGGQRGGAADDLWALDLVTHTWTDLAPGDRPRGRIFASQVYDANNDRVIIFGGNRDRDGVDALTDEVLSFDLDQGNWVELVPSGGSPEAREGSAAIYVGSQDRLVLFGGNGLSGNFADVWSIESLSGERPTVISDEQPWGWIKSSQND